MNKDKNDKTYMDYVEWYLLCPKCHKQNVFMVSDNEIKNDFHFSCTHCESEYPLSEYLTPADLDISNAEHPYRKIAIKILESIAEVYGNPDMFDGSEVINEDGTITKCEPDGTWYEYEDMIVDIIDKGI